LTLQSASIAMSPLTAVCPLPDLGVLRFRGTDCRRFLQGQLSGDLARLAPGGLMRAGLHNPQGRTLALLTLLAWSEEDLGAILPLELLADIAALLRRYVLRARVTISDESAALRVFGLQLPALAVAPPAAVPFAAGRALCVLPAEGPAPDGPALAREHWRALDIADGLPQVYRETSGQFVAQMLNLDCIDAISFSKGCYTGQEVIARAHYRGRVKRRMQRFASPAPLRLTAGQDVELEDGRIARVVEAAQLPERGTEFLAVAPLPAADGAVGAVAEETGIAGARVHAAALALPYPLPV